MLGRLMSCSRSAVKYLPLRLALVVSWNFLCSNNASYGEHAVGDNLALGAKG